MEGGVASFLVIIIQVCDGALLFLCDDGTPFRGQYAPETGIVLIFNHVREQLITFRHIHPLFSACLIPPRGICDSHAVDYYGAHVVLLGYGYAIFVVDVVACQ